MTDCFFIAGAANRLPDALQGVQVEVVKAIRAYKQRMVDLGRRKEVVDLVCRFEIQSYSILPEMIPVQSGLLAAGNNQQFVPQYTVVVLVIVKDGELVE